MRYTFGDSDLAARRLRVVADVFAPSSSAFLREAVSRPPELAAQRRELLDRYRDRGVISEQTYDRAMAAMQPQPTTKPYDPAATD